MNLVMSNLMMINYFTDAKIMEYYLATFDLMMTMMMTMMTMTGLLL